MKKQILNWLNKKNPRNLYFLSLRPKFVLQQFFNLLGIDYQFADLNNIVLYVNSVCNVRCLMCDVGQRNKQGIDRLRLIQENQNLKLELLDKLLNDPYISGRRIGFYILMTEPLLHPDIYEIVRMIRERGHNVKIATNGFLLPERAAGLAASGLNSIQISLDGPPKIHDYIRGVEGTYKRAMEGLRILSQKKKLEVIINYTVSSLNDSEILNFLDAIDKENIKIDLVKFQFLNFISKEMADRQNEKYDIKQRESTISDVVHPAKVNSKEVIRQLGLIRNDYKNIKKIDIIPNLKDDSQMFEYFDIKGEKIEGNSKCFMPWHNFAFTTDGKILIHMRCFDFVYGDFNKNSIKEIFHNDRVSWFRKKLRKADYCFPACTRCCGVMRSSEKWSQLG